ncbi:MAG: dioxygenase, partial [Vicinamibacteria bacterium]
RLERRAVGEIVGYRVSAPHPELAAPTTEHLDPIFFALGASGAADRASTIYSGFTFGTLSMRSFALSS